MRSSQTPAIFSRTRKEVPIPIEFRFSDVPEANKAAILRAEAVFGVNWRERAKLIGRDTVSDGGEWEIVYSNAILSADAPRAEIATIRNDARHDISPDLPGLVEFYDNGIISTIGQYDTGTLSNPPDGSPSIRQFYRNGKMKSREFCINDIRENAPDGSPSIVLFTESGQVYEMSFMEDNQLADPQKGPYKGYPARLTFATTTRQPTISGGMSSVRGDLSKKQAQEWIDQWNSRKIVDLCSADSEIIALAAASPTKAPILDAQRATL